jgi:hypothetical protein
VSPAPSATTLPSSPAASASATGRH